MCSDLRLERRATHANLKLVDRLDVHRDAACHG